MKGRDQSRDKGSTQQYTCLEENHGHSNALCLLSEHRASLAVSFLAPKSFARYFSRVYFFKYLLLQSDTIVANAMAISPFSVKLPQNYTNLPSRLILCLGMAPVTGQDGHVCLVPVIFLSRKSGYIKPLTLESRQF